MEPKFGTSFIPKKTLATAAGTQKKGKRPLSIVALFVIITFIMALGSVVLSVGLFLYQQVIETNISRKTDTLNRAQAAFEPALIQELVRIDSRINAAETILNQHITPSVLFEALEELTLKSVQFQNFNLSKAGDNKINISMKGIANDFSGVALQAEVFGNSKLIRDPIFSNLNLNQNGGAVFSFSAFVDTSFINFVNEADGTGLSN